MEKFIDTFIAEYLGATTLSYVVIVITIIIVAVIIRKLVRKSIESYLDHSAGKLNVDATKYTFVKNAIGAIVYLFAILVIFLTIPSLRTFAYGMFAGAGLVAAALAFASQHALANIVGGIFIVIFKPFRVGDNVRIGTEHIGIIEELTLRHTVIRNFENRRVIIPNSVISSETILNSTISDPKICNFIEFGISYDSSINKAMEIIKEECETHPNILDNRSEEEKMEGKPMVVIRVIQHADSAIILRAYAWAEDTAKAWVMRCDLLKSVKERFDREGIEIPFPHRTIVMKEKKGTDSLK